MAWHEELVNLVGGAGVHHYEEPAAAEEEPEGRDLGRKAVGDGYDEGAAVEESLVEQVKGFLAASGELLQEMGRGCRDILQQSLEGAEDSYLVKRLRGPAAAVARRLEFLNEYLPEDREPVQCWPVVILVMIIALTVINVNSEDRNSVQQPKAMYIPPPSATRIQLPDGRYMAYLKQGVPAELARFSLIAPHSFLSSRLVGIPGIKLSLLEEFGVQLLTYDLPGFGESDPHPGRNLNSSAMDMLYLADAVGIKEKFWVLGYSGGSMHAWAAVHYIPDRIAGAAIVAPMGNPYESAMTKEERNKAWEKWTMKRKLLYIMARKLPSALPYFYRRSFLSGIQGQPEKWLALSIGKKDKALLEDRIFREFWERDVAESVRQGDARPFVEEAVLQVTNWGFKLADLQAQKKHNRHGLLSWLGAIFAPADREWAGFTGPIHIWQGMDDRVVPPSMAEYARRVVPGVTVHKLLGEGHFSYFCFCDGCHRQVLSTLFGTPLSPLTPAELEAARMPPPPPPEECSEDTSCDSSATPPSRRLEEFHGETEGSLDDGTPHLLP